MHEIIAAALRELGVAAMPHSEPEVQPPCRSCLCFQHFTAGDLMIDQFKVVGSAQRRIRRALMQHGSILPATSPHTPMLPGIRELSGRELSPSELGSVMQHTFSRQTDWPLITSDRTQGEKRRIEELSHDKYAHDTWNSRR
jgi:lipoate-protein ligase A